MARFLLYEHLSDMIGSIFIKAEGLTHCCSLHVDGGCKLLLKLILVHVSWTCSLKVFLSYLHLEFQNLLNLFNEVVTSSHGYLIPLARVRSCIWRPVT